MEKANRKWSEIGHTLALSQGVGASAVKHEILGDVMEMGTMGSTYGNHLSPAAMFFDGAYGAESGVNPTQFGAAPLLPLPKAAKSKNSEATTDQSVSQALVLDHLQTVRYVARKIHEGLPQHVDLEELVSAGMLGLIDAAGKFKNDKNTQFKTYAQFRIRGAILDSLRSVDWSPRELRRKGRDAEAAIRLTTQRLGRTPSDVEVASEMSLPLPEYQKLLSDLKSLEIGSLNAERNEESGEEELAYIAAPSDEDPLFRCMKAEMKQHLVDAIDALPERERMVLTLYYYEELSMKEIAQLLGVVESRVSQIRSSAVLRVRSALAAFAQPQRTNRRAAQAI